MFLRWTARVLGAVVLAFLLFPETPPFAIGEGAPLFGAPEATLLTALLALALVSYLAAWRWEGVGGAALLLVGLTMAGFAYWTAGTNKALIALIMVLLFAVPGGLFLAARKR